jgi:hypothetical protein
VAAAKRQDGSGAAPGAGSGLIDAAAAPTRFDPPAAPTRTWTTARSTLTSSTDQTSLDSETSLQFGFFGVALALVTWFSGAAICVLVGACAGSVFAEDPGRVGMLIRGGERSTLAAGARPPLSPPVRERSLRDAFRSNEDS